MAGWLHHWVRRWLVVVVMSGPMIWGQNMMLPSQQVRAMPAEVLKHAVLTNIERLEIKARELGIEEPQVNTMFISEWYHAGDEEEDD